MRPEAALYYLIIEFLYPISSVNTESTLSVVRPTMPSSAQNVGIKALEIYFPSRVSWPGSNVAPVTVTRTFTNRSQYVPQPELETFLGASAGKYTIGLGQQNMSFCDDREGEQPIRWKKHQQLTA
jgi:hypothetical protein